MAAARGRFVKGGDVVYNVTADTEGLEKTLAGVRNSVEAHSKKIGVAMTAAGAAVTGVVVAVAKNSISLAEEVNSSIAKIQTQFNISAEAAQDFGDVIRNVYRNNFGDSLTDVGETVTIVAAQLRDAMETGSEEVQKATEYAYGLRDAFGVDISKSANAAASLIKNFGATTDEAFAALTFGFQHGLDASEDFLDSIGEYSTQFANGGASIAEFFSVMETGMQSGMLGTDKAADAFKEFQVRILDGSKATAEGLELLGINAKEFTNQIATGQMPVIDAFQAVLDKLRGVNDQSVLMQAGVGLLGTQFEDLGVKTVQAMDTTSLSMIDMGERLGDLNNQYDTLSAKWEGLMRKFDLAMERIGQALIPILSEVLDKVIPIVDTFTSWVEANPELTVQILAISAAIGGLMLALGPLIIALPGIVTAIGLLSGPLGWVVLGFGAAAAAVAYFWEEIQTKLPQSQEMLEGAWARIVEGAQYLLDVGATAFQYASDWIGENWDQLARIVSTSVETARHSIDILVNVFKVVLKVALTSLGLFVEKTGEEFIKLTGDTDLSAEDFLGIIEYMGETVEELFGKLSDFIGDVVGWLDEHWENIAWAADWGVTLFLKPIFRMVEGVVWAFEQVSWAIGGIRSAFGFAADLVGFGAPDLGAGASAQAAAAIGGGGGFGRGGDSITNTNVGGVNMSVNAGNLNADELAGKIARILTNDLTADLQAQGVAF